MQLIKLRKTLDCNQIKFHYERLHWLTYPRLSLTG